MKIIQLQFCLLLWCGAAEGFTDQLVDLGQNVTLDCEIDVKNVYWFLMKASHPTVFILRSFTSTITEPSYGNTTFRERFSLQFNSSLFIQNITVNELGIYYCIHTVLQTSSPPIISNGIRIHTKQRSDEVSPDHHNQTEKGGLKKDEGELDWKRYLIISVLLNCGLVIAVIGMTVFLCKRTSKLQPQPPDSTGPNLQQHQDLGCPQYEEIELPTSTSAVRLSPVNSTYAMLQHPKPQRRA